MDKQSFLAPIVSAERAWVDEFEGYLLEDGRSLSPPLARVLAGLTRDTRCLVSALQNQEAMKGRHAPMGEQTLASELPPRAFGSVSSRSRLLRTKLLRLRRTVQRGTEEAKARREFVSMITLRALSQSHQRTSDLLRQYTSTVGKQHVYAYAAA